MVLLNVQDLQYFWAVAKEGELKQAADNAPVRRSLEKWSTPLSFGQALHMVVLRARERRQR